MGGAAMVGTENVVSKFWFSIPTNSTPAVHPSSGRVCYSTILELINWPQNPCGLTFRGREKGGRGLK